MRVPELDRDLVERAVDADRAALEQVVVALERPLYDLSLRMLLVPADAEDAAQECLLRVITRLSQFRGEARFSTWVLRVAINCLLDVRRRHRRVPRLTFDAFAADLRDGLDAYAPERADDAALLSELKVGCARALLECLDDDERAAYALGEILGLGGDEAASIVEVPPATFRKRLSRARERLRAALEQSCGIVSQDAPCLCHRRLARARALGRAHAPPPGAPVLDLVELRNKIRDLDRAERVAAYYRADPQAVPLRDLARATLRVLSPASSS
jgi:RNA polymerase sigma factor (sigma-70 family)